MPVSLVLRVDFMQWVRCLWVFLACLAVWSRALAEDGLDPQAVIRQLRLPVGFSITVFAADLPSARGLAVGDDGVVYAGSRDGWVRALRDADGDGVAEQRYLLADGLFMPNGLAFKNGALYVVEVRRIIRFDDVAKHLTSPPRPVTVYDQFPAERLHGWKYLRFGPDGKLYTALGAPCNVCESEDPRFASLMRLNPDGSQLEILARGVRNSVGFDWQPGTNRLFFNDNGRDHLGDDLPAEELNAWREKGEHFGFPYCHAGDTPDPEFGRAHACAEFTAPVWRYAAHIAPLGMRFYTGAKFPAEYREQLFVAQHGSWNRSIPQGYRVAVVKFKNGQPVGEQGFIEGWLKPDGAVLGRPVDIVQMADGALLISDDRLGVIYKVDYRP